MTASREGGFPEAPASPPEGRARAKIHFLRHLFLRNSEIALAIITIGLGIGVLGYHFIVGLPWIDALLNASMILAGMGPVDPIRTSSGKLFASFYALFSGLAFLTIAATYLQSGARIFFEHHGLLPGRRDGRHGESGPGAAHGGATSVTHTGAGPGATHTRSDA